jgi:hypothetical protein
MPAASSAYPGIASQSKEPRFQGTQNANGSGDLGKTHQFGTLVPRRQDPLEVWANENPS